MVSNETRSKHRRRPNSRTPLILMGLALVLIIAAVLIVPTLIADGDDDDASDPSRRGPADGGWVQANIYDGATGQGVSISPDGKVIESFNDMGRFIDSRVIARSQSITFIGETVEIGPVPGDRSGPPQFSMPVPDTATISVLGVPDRLVMAMHYADGGNITIIDADKRRTLNIAELLNNPAPNYTLDQLQLEPSGERFAVYDKDSDQTAVISFARPQPSFFKHRALAISLDRLVTANTQDRQTTVTVYDNDAAVISQVESEPVISATMDGRTAYLITDEFDIVRLDANADTLTTLTRVPDAEKVAVAADGERLIVDSPWGFAILDETGAEMGRLRPGSGGVENPERESECLATDVNELVTRSGNETAVQRGPAVMRLDDLQLMAVAQLPIHTSTPDSCTVATEIGDINTYQLASATSKLNLATEDEIPTVGPYDRMFLSPNPNQWIALQPDSSVGLFELVDGKAELIADIPFPDVDYITVSYLRTSPDS